MKRSSMLFMATVAAVMMGGMARAADDDVDAAALAKALPGAPVSLAQGLKASQARGRPISGKFEVEDGALQLSVYTAKGGQFFEVIIDHKSGKVAKTEEIKEGQDLKKAQDQSLAMAKATSSLQTASANAVKANAGYRAVSVKPEMKNSHPMADVILMKGKSVRHAQQKLD